MAGHKYKVEKFLGWKLHEGAEIHHINRNHYDNRLENLFVFNIGRDHAAFHRLVNRGYLKLDALTSNLTEIKKHTKIAIKPKRKVVLSDNAKARKWWKHQDSISVTQYMKKIIKESTEDTCVLDFIERSN